MFMRTIRNAVMLAALALGVAVTEARAQQRLTAINPGIKIGHTFGENGGFTLGIELTITSTWFHDDDNGLPTFLGGAFAYDYCFGSEQHKLHLGCEGGVFRPVPIGADIGPTWIWRGHQEHLAIGTNVFGFVIANPFVGVAIPLDGAGTVTEWGVYGKLPIPVAGDTPNFFGHL
jgi:hypothetical protein